MFALNSSILQPKSYLIFFSTTSFFPLACETSNRKWHAYMHMQINLRFQLYRLLFSLYGEISSDSPNKIFKLRLSTKFFSFETIISKIYEIKQVFWIFNWFPKNHFRFFSCKVFEWKKNKINQIASVKYTYKWLKWTVNRCIRFTIKALFHTMQLVLQSKLVASAQNEAKPNRILMRAVFHAANRVYLNILFTFALFMFAMLFPALKFRMLCFCFCFRFNIKKLI